MRGPISQAPFDLGCGSEGLGAGVERTVNRITDGVQVALDNLIVFAADVGDLSADAELTGLIFVGGLGRIPQFNTNIVELRIAAGQVIAPDIVESDNSLLFCNQVALERNCVS